MEDRILTRDEMINIPGKHLPLMVLTDNLISLFSARIKSITHGLYNHYCWYIMPGELASQDVTFKRVLVEKYLEVHRIKLWWNPEWTENQRAILLEAIWKGLKEPWYRRMYDPVQVAGLRLTALTGINFKWLQIPGSARICSDHADYLKFVDHRYNLSHPDPSEVNRWLKQTGGYEVYGRFFPD